MPQHIVNTPFTQAVMPLIMALIAWFGCFPLAAVTISSRVLDPQARGIPQALITDGSVHTFSSVDGYFHLESAADSLSISRLGYLPRSVSLVDATRPIILQPDPLSLSPIRVYERFERGSAAALDAHSIHPDTNQGRRSAGDLLLEHYALDSSATPLSGEISNISILGNLSRHTLVLIDGIPANTDGTPFDFSRIPASQISHIELIKGASSVYGGSSAIGGIINIVTHSPQTSRHLELESGAGSFGMYHARALGSIGKSGYQISAEYSHSSAQNDFPYSSSQGSATRHNNSKRQDQFFMKAARNHNHVQVEGLLSLSAFSRELPGSVNNLPLFDDARMRGTDAIYRLAMIYTRRLWNNEFSISGDASRSTYRNLDSTYNNYRSHTRSSYMNLSFKDIFTWSPGPFAVELAAERRHVVYDRENLLNSAQSFSKPKIGALTGLAGFVRHLQDWDLILWEQGFGLRQDHAPRSGEQSDLSETTWRIEQSLSLHLPLQPRVYGSIGTAFSLPSYQDMYWMGDSQAEGNSDLESESSRGWLAGMQLGNSRFRVTLEHSQNRIRNLIRWQQHDGIHWKPKNLGEALLSNLDLSAELYPVKSLTLSGGIVFTHAKDKSPGINGLPGATYNRFLIYTPDAKASVAASLTRANWGGNILWRYTGAQYTTPDNLAGSIPGFDTVDVSAWLKPLPQKLPLTLNAALHNVLDSRYEIYAHTPQPGINWQMGLKLEF